MNTSQQRYLKAARFTAATGQYSLASALLDLVKDDDLKSEVEILRGHIHAQMGRYSEAISLWEKVLVQSPKSVEIPKAIRKARQMQESSFRVPSSRSRLVIVFIGSVCLVLLLAASFGVGRWTILRDQEGTRAGLAELGSSIGKLGTTLSKEHEAVTTAISNFQQQLQTSAWQHTVDITNQIGSARDGILATGELVNRLAGNVSNELRSVRAQQDQLAGQQAAHQHAVSNLLLGVETVRRETKALDERIAKQQLRSEQLLRTTVDLLRPGNMDRLAREIGDAEGTLTRLKMDETRYRAENRQVLVSRHRSILKQLRDTEKQLKDLQDQWNLQVVPWLRAQNALGPRDE